MSSCDTLSERRATRENITEALNEGLVLLLALRQDSLRTTYYSVVFALRKFLHSFKTFTQRNLLSLCMVLDIACTELDLSTW